MVCIREGRVEDAKACAEIYSHYVHNTIITFEVPPEPTALDFEDRIRAAHCWLVVTDGDSGPDNSASDDAAIVGFAYATTFHPRSAYRWSTATSIYLSATSSHHRRGTGTALYTALLERLAQMGFRQAFGLVTLPNAASCAIHEKFGFEKVGHCKRVGWKLGKWRDVLWYQLDLNPALTRREIEEEDDFESAGPSPTDPAPYKT